MAANENTSILAALARLSQQVDDLTAQIAAGFAQQEKTLSQIEKRLDNFMSGQVNTNAEPRVK